MNFIQISGGPIPTLWHNLEIRFVGKGCHMEFAVMRIKKSEKRKGVMHYEKYNLAITSAKHHYTYNFAIKINAAGYLYHLYEVCTE